MPDQHEEETRQFRQAEEVDSQNTAMVNSVSYWKHLELSSTLGRHLGRSCLSVVMRAEKRVEHGSKPPYRPGLLGDVICFCLISSTLAMSVST